MPCSTLSYWPEAKAWNCWSGVADPAAVEAIGKPITGVWLFASADWASDVADQPALPTHWLIGWV